MARKDEVKKAVERIVSEEGLADAWCKHIDDHSESGQITAELWARCESGKGWSSVLCGPGDVSIGHAFLLRALTRGNVFSIIFLSFLLLAQNIRLIERTIVGMAPHSPR